MYDLEQFVAEAGQFADYIFARGYIISDTKPVCPAWWKRVRFNELHVAYDPKVHVRIRKRGDVSLLFIGILFDTRNPNLSQEDQEIKLGRRLANGENAFLKEIDNTGGRFVIMYKTLDGEFQLIHDAAGLRSVFYGRGNARVASSHMKLTALNLENVVLRPPMSFRFGYPGLDTPINGVSLLTPNTKLVWSQMRPRRYWPIETLPSLSEDEALDVFVSLLVNSYEWLSKAFNPFVTITAGTDSRVSLAVAKTKGRYVTYYRSDEVETDKLDRDFALTAAAKFGLDHTLIMSREIASVPEGLHKVFDINTYYRHLPHIANIYRTNLAKEEGTIHIRSNLSEIGRMFYRGKIQARSKNYAFSPDVMSTADDMLRVWTANADLRTEQNKTSFEEFIELTDFASAPIDKPPLFYWEHRMGTWHSQVVTESDIACESVSLYNSRNIIKAMLSIPASYQQNSWLMRAAVERLWPELTQYPVNGKPFQLVSKD